MLPAPYNTTTVGKAFEKGTFQSPEWTRIEAKKGVVVIEFHGTVVYGHVQHIGTWFNGEYLKTPGVPTLGKLKKNDGAGGLLTTPGLVPSM